MLYEKSPFDLVYERGDSVALAVISEKIYFPSNSNEVIHLIINHFNIIFILYYSVLFFFFLVCQQFNKDNVNSRSFQKTIY